jgi:hypothetical protein
MLSEPDFFDIGQTARIVGVNSANPSRVREWA